jgi:hypothetical protein
VCSLPDCPSPTIRLHGDAIQRRPGERPVDRISRYLLAGQPDDVRLREGDGRGQLSDKEPVQPRPLPGLASDLPQPTMGRVG